MRVGRFARLVDAGRRFMARWGFGSAQGALRDQSVAQPAATADSTSARAATPNRRREWCLSVFLLVAACAFSGWLAYPNQIVPRPNGGLVVEQEELDFGEVWEDRTFPWKFTIHNPTAEPIEIKEFWSSCGCAVAKPRSVTIPERQKAEITLTLDLSAATPHLEAGTASGRSKSFEARIIPVMEDRPFQQGWHVKGRVIVPITVSSHFIDFGATIQGERIKEKAIDVLCHTAVAALAVARDGRLAVNKITRIGPDEFRLAVAPRQNLPPGSFDFEVVIETLPSNHAYKVPIRITGEVLREIDVVPTHVLLGPTRLNRFVDEIVCVKSRRGRDFSVDRVETPSTDTQIEPLQQSLQNEACFRLRQFITRAGHNEIIATFLTRVDDGLVEIPVTISYYGLAD